MKKILADLTAEELRRQVSYDPVTGEFHWLVHPKRGSTKHKPGDRADTPGCGYLRIAINGVRYLAHRLAWLWMTGEWPEKEIDHRDLNRANNQWNNLRPATRSLNSANRPAASAGTASGLKGAYPSKNGRRFDAKIKIDYCSRHLGSFATPEEAHAAYMRAAKELFGEFARAA